MRRMITSKQAKGLEKLNENIVINEDGTKVQINGDVAIDSDVEIFGNVVVESIEQIGSMVDVPGSFKIDFANQFAPISVDNLIGTDVTAVSTIQGAFVDFSTYVQTTTRNVGDLYTELINIEEGPGYTDCLIWYKAPGVFYACNEWNGAALSVTGNATDYAKSITSGAISDIVEPGKEFKSFFTEAQYEALLALIED